MFTSTIEIKKNTYLLIKIWNYDVFFWVNKSFCWLANKVNKLYQFYPFFKIKESVQLNSMGDISQIYLIHWWILFHYKMLIIDTIINKNYKELIIEVYLTKH